MGKITKAFSFDTEEELNNAIIQDGLSRTKRSQAAVALSNGHSLSLEQRVENLVGQTKVLYDRLDDIKKVQGIPQDILDKINDNQNEIIKNKDSVNQNHLDYNEFLKTHPTEDEIEAKLSVLNNLITGLKTTQSNAQLLINQNADKLKNLKTYLIPSNFRKTFKVISGDGPTINPILNTLTYGKIGQLITLDFDIPDEGCDVEIVMNNVDPYSFYIPSYTSTSDNPLRARLQAGGLDFQVHGPNAKVQVWCTADPKIIGIFEWRTKWTKGSV